MTSIFYIKICIREMIVEGRPDYPRMIYYPGDIITIPIVSSSITAATDKFTTDEYYRGRYKNATILGVSRLPS